MTPTLIISLDFELMWGVRDHRTVASYGDAVLGVRAALPAILQRFSAAGIRATWATVGLLFARSRDEMLDYAPSLRPAYRDASLSPYPVIEREIGGDEVNDPLHYGRSLLDRILDTEGQEVATHTYSHYYCLEEGPSLAAFDADLKSALAIAANAGVKLDSIVFPRNQMGPEHVRQCADNGIRCFRGNVGSFAYRPRSRKENTLLVRGTRLLDGIFPLMGMHSFREIDFVEGMANVPASRFLRPWTHRAPAYSHLHVSHVLREMRSAAESGAHYHLWWHPHNFGRNALENLAQLDRILELYQQLHDSTGLRSRNMRDMLETCRIEPSEDQP